MTELKKFAKLKYEKQRFMEETMRRTALFVFFLFITAGGAAMIQTMSLEQLVHTSELIFIGHITGIKSTGKLPEGPEVMANLAEVSQALKGEIKTGDKIKIKTYSGITDNTVFREGQKYILFLQKNENHFEVVNGVQGAWPIEKDGTFSGMGHGKKLEQIKAAIDSIPLKLQPRFEPLSL